MAEPLPRADRRWPRLRLLPGHIAGSRLLRCAVLGIAALCGACAHTPRLTDADLAMLLQRLPGHYDNRQQAGHVALELDVSRLDAGLVGDNVFFMRLTAADDARRVVSQRIWSFAQNKDGGVVQSVYVFTQPERWRRGAGDPQLFESLLTQDLRALNGCELDWKKSGTLYEGETGAGCKAGAAPGTGLLIEQHIVAAGDSLALAERQFGEDGTLTAAGSADPFERFVRRGKSAADARAGDESAK